MSATPACISTMLEVWNTRDPAALRTKAQAALTADAEFVDPHYDIRGVDAFVAMVEAFHGKYPNARIERTSGVDLHHDRARYSWAVVGGDGRRFDGFDAVALDLTQGKVRRIDGFFGPLPAL